MNKHIKTLISPIILFSVSCFSCASEQEKEFPSSFSVRITNTPDRERSSVLVFLPASDIQNKASDFNPKAFIVIANNLEIPSQYNNGNGDQGVALVLDRMGASESLELIIRYNPNGESPRNYDKLTQAELSHKVGGEWKDREYMGGEFKNVNFLRVPPQHKDHSWFIRYEGPGWESDKVGYRFYLDQRNATDVFGKKVTEPVLQKAGQDGFDSYHEMQDWGMDVMKVGKSLGVGSMGMWVDTCAVRVESTDSLTSEVLENGVVYSSIRTKYFGWKTRIDTVDAESTLSIHAGTRVTCQSIKLTNDSDQLCTGLVKDEKAKLITREPEGSNFGYIATYGPQSLNNDKLGIAVLFAASDFAGLDEDQFSHIVKLKSSGKELNYYFLAAWEGEPGGITTEEEFVSYLDKVTAELSSPVVVSFD